MTEKKEVSQLARQILSGGGHVQLFTQQEFDEALAIGRAEIMTIAIETTKQALLIEREACAELAKEDGHPELAEKILNRIPSQRQ
jgi:hypothetical protein